jgi:hypothetical protein
MGMVLKGRTKVIVSVTLCHARLLQCDYSSFVKCGECGIETIGAVSVIDPVTQSFLTLLRDGGLRGLPCDEWTVSDIARQLKVELPRAYLAFLLLAGHGCEPLEGSHYAVDDDLAGLQRAGHRIARHEKTELPKDAFVFLVHQGFACQFFLLDDGDDPAVYQCVEGMGLERVMSHFSEWVLGEVARSNEFRERRS